jgi:hypothetical protein
VNKNSRLGRLPPKHIFILSPYTDARFTRYPICEEKARLVHYYSSPVNPAKRQTVQILPVSLFGCVGGRH